ncbi:YihY family inner membrane protein [Ferrovum sp. PN-J185]|uniref:YihY family inner membrane protein n=1 Tax=Ferrovum sp. PN-J185 TaxID=1356306 RepID=UPI000796C81D|nr:YihY family inner membrane protein [Ferrovum sp. PN-J185]KXW55444.1 ribonuclease BN/unknown domain fusion protein [Ferrovum sp. PN-J185]
MKRISIWLFPLTPLLNTLGFLWFVLKKFHQDRCLQTASSLTTTTLFAIIPLVTLSLSMYSLMPGSQLISKSVRSFLMANLLPDVASRMISMYTLQFSQHAEQLTVVGLGVLLFAVLSLVVTVDHAFNAVWGSTPKHQWYARLMMYLIVVVGGPVMLGVTLWAFTTAIKTSLGWVGESHHLINNAIQWSSLITLVLILSSAYYIIPGKTVKKRHALVGGIVAAFAFEGLKNGLTWFITHFSAYKIIYGAFAALPIFLLWIQLSWAVVLFCAVLTASLPTWKMKL